MEEHNCFYYLASVKGDDNGEFFAAKNRAHAVQSIREYFQQYSEFTYAEVWKDGNECEILLDTLELNKGVSIHHVEYICAIDENDEPMDDIVLVDREHEYALQPTSSVQLDLSVWGLYKAFDN